MVTIFMTRRQYDRMCGKWEINGEEQKAYLSAKRKWSLEGVKITTNNAKLIEMIKSVKQEK